MENNLFDTLGSGYCSSCSIISTKQACESATPPGVYLLVSNSYARSKVVFKGQYIRILNTRSFMINAEIRGNATNGASLDKTSFMEGLHKNGEKVAGKYKIIGILGKGGASITYEAEGADGEKVALKAMSLRNMRGWKDLDLFKRECRVLQSLQHPSIPQYIDYFEVDTDKDRIFYIVQKIASGNSLADLVESGWRVSEDEVKIIALKVLEILKYLESLRPPVIHRDIKPENIIWDARTSSVSLVDFGAVQDAVSMTIIGSTVVGTKRLKLDFRGLVPMSSYLADIIDRLLEPAPEDRFQSAEEVITILKSENVSFNDVDSRKNYSSVTSNPKVRQPAGTKVILTRTPSKLNIHIPPGGLTAETAGTGTFAVAWNAFIAFWTSSAIRMGAPILFTLFSLPFWFVGIGLAKRAFSGLMVSVDLNFGSEVFSITWQLANIWRYHVNGQTKDISSARVVVDVEQNGRPITACCIKEGVKSHTFGVGLEPIEKEWLIQEINDFLGLEPPPLDHFILKPMARQ